MGRWQQHPIQQQPRGNSILGFDMPIYHYKCKACGREFSVKEDRMTSGRTQDCIEVPFCSGKANRMVARSSFSLKGEGWFKDGY